MSAAAEKLYALEAALHIQLANHVKEVYLPDGETQLAALKNIAEMLLNGYIKEGMGAESALLHTSIYGPQEVVRIQSMIHDHLAQVARLLALLTITNADDYAIFLHQDGTMKVGAAAD